MLARLKTANETLKLANAAVQPTIIEENMQRECETILEYDDRAITAITRLECCLNVQRSVSAGASAASTSAAMPLEPVVVVERGSNAKLPKMQLTKFNGDIKSWIPFWEEFKTAVHENKSLNGTAKFNYLRTVLTGKAADSIAGFTPTESCYNDAIMMLREEYGTTDRIIEKYMQSLMTTSSVRSRTDITGLRRLYNNTNATLRSMNALGIPAIQYGMMVKSILLRSIPNEMRISYHRQYSSGAGTGNESVHSGGASTTSECEIQVQRLLDYIKTEVDALEKSEDASGHAQEPINKERKHPQSKVATAAGLYTAVQDNCVFCKSKNHQTSQCNSSLTIAQRKDILQRESRCFRCTKSNHSSRYCRVKNISCAKCKRRHVTAMCDPNFNERGNATQQRDANNEIVVNTQTLNLTSSELNNVYLQTACAFVAKPKDNGNHQVMIRLILDGGSQLTFIKECVSRKLDLPVVGTHNISLIPFGCKNSAPARLCNKVQLKLINRHTGKEVFINAVEVPEICLDTLKVPEINHPQLKKLHMADARGGNLQQIRGISLLIGADQYWQVTTGETQRISQELVAINTNLGWTLHGPTPIDNCNINLNIATVLSCRANEEMFEVNKFWDLQAIGINEQCETEHDFLDKYSRECIVFNNGRYEVTLPWKNQDAKLDNNYIGASVRVKSLISRLLKNNRLLEYDGVMREYINNGIAETVLDVNESERNEREYYLPHRPVYRHDKETTKIRIVFDASAHAIGQCSLNDQLFPGTNLIPDLLKILLNFRVGIIAITADIEKAFLQISLNENERDCHRFLWFKDPLKTPAELPPIEVYRMTRLTFGVTSSPFILAATIQKHLNKQKSNSKISNILKNSFYVDDLIVSVRDVKYAEKLYNTATEIMQSGGMNLRKWHSNNVNLRELFNDSVVVSKVLGIMWYEVADEIGVDLSPTLEFLKNVSQGTKRIILQTISRIFDPLGMLGPFSIKLKILLQDLWKLKPEWDDVLPLNLQSLWNSWKEQLHILENFSVPRCAAGERCTLHVFADASPLAYGAVAYLRSESVNGVTVRLLCAKNRVAPLKSEGDKLLTLPRLELTAALVASRLANFITSNGNFQITNVYLWSDSKITLYWIMGNPDSWKQYVSNRVREIKRLTKTFEWIHCTGEWNPADLLTRGIKANDLIKSELWVQGPPWLSEDSDYWPREKDREFSEIADEVTAMKIATVTNEKRSEPIFQWERYSNLRKIIRITCYVFRFIYNLKSSVNKRRGVFSADELNTGELYWVKYAQENEYFSEIQALKNGNDIENRSSILSLNPFLDDNAVLRLKGRLQKGELQFTTTHPSILPKNSRLSELLIRDAHYKLHHSGVNSVLAAVRAKYWIVKGRQLVKTLIARCVICKRLRGKSASEPFAPLPKDRVMIAIPFENMGIDFAGPLYVKGLENPKKVYIMLITCAVVRAIHLELILDLTTESCIKGLRRFVARRGVPKNIYSDNAKTFKRAAKELQELAEFVGSKHLKEYLAKHRIDWHFIVERAAWWGGWCGP